jgi:hypothetical protein
VDAGCRRLTASWVREAALKSPDIETCSFFEGHEKAGQEALLPPGGHWGLNSLKCSVWCSCWIPMVCGPASMWLVVLWHLLFQQCGHFGTWPEISVLCMTVHLK